MIFLQHSPPDCYALAGLKSNQLENSLRAIQSQYIASPKKEKEVKSPLLLSLFASSSVCLLAVFFVWNGEFLAAFSATWCQYAATGCCCHSLTETVLVIAATVVGLKCSFHIVCYCLIIMSHSDSGCKIKPFFSFIQVFGNFLLITFQLFNFFTRSTFLFFNFILTFAAEMVDKVISCLVV